MFGLCGVVVIGGALLGGPVERSGLPPLAVFLALGLLIGPFGLRLIHLDLDSALLRVVATLSLTLVLFTDAMTLDLREVRANARMAALILGPGTLIAAALLGGAAWLLLGLPPALALILGAALASTDPVILRGMLQGSGMGERMRLALRLESGMNDVLLLPIVVIALAFVESATPPEAGDLARMLVSLFLLGPLAGVAVGMSAVRLLVWVRDRFGVRREYEALYVIGVALGAYAAAEALGGSGFLAAFAAGLVVSSLDVELCDCFLEYGQVTAEMALLFTFVLLGTSPIWSGLGAAGPLTLAFAALALLVRLPIFALAMRPLGLPLVQRVTLGWYGPRGLGALLLVLLAVFDGVPAGERLFSLASLVVLASIAFQGGWPLLRRRPKAPLAPPPAAVIPLTRAPGDLLAELLATAPPAPLSPPALRQPDMPDRVNLEQLRRLKSRGEPITLIDVRTERSYRASDTVAAGALRVPPDRAVATLRKHGVPANAWVVAYCT
nr:cation:proton antiporter [Oscillochloris sp. ZM17-4]